MKDYQLCGWRVRSALALPDLLPWAGLETTPVDLTISLGPVPRLTGPLFFNGPLLQSEMDGTCRFSVPGIATYRVDPVGTAITLEPILAEDDPAIRAFLLGTVFALVCQRRGVVPLHACSIRLETPNGPAAIAVAAISGTGKSTLAAEFRAQGCAVLADDVTVVDAEGMAIPTFPRLKLWNDTLRHLGQDTENLERVRQGMNKFSLPLRAEFATEPLPLVAVYHLSRVQNQRHASLERLRGLPATLSLIQAVYQDRALMLTSSKRAEFAGAVTAVAARIPQHWKMVEPLGFDRLAELVTRLRNEYAAGPAR